MKSPSTSFSTSWYFRVTRSKCTITTGKLDARQASGNCAHPPCPVFNKTIGGQDCPDGPSSSGDKRGTELSSRKPLSALRKSSYNIELLTGQPLKLMYSCTSNHSSRPRLANTYSNTIDHASLLISDANTSMISNLRPITMDHTAYTWVKLRHTNTNVIAAWVGSITLRALTDRSLDALGQGSTRDIKRAGRL